MAELVFRQQLATAGLAGVVATESAGIGDWHVDDPADRRARAALERRGYPTDHRARQFEATFFGDSDLVIALDRENRKDLRRLAPTREDADGVRLLLDFDQNAETEDVPDPYFGDAAGFDNVLDMIEQACGGLVTHLSDELERPGMRA